MLCDQFGVAAMEVGELNGAPDFMLEHSAWLKYVHSLILPESLTIYEFLCHHTQWFGRMHACEVLACLSIPPLYPASRFIRSLCFTKACWAYGKAIIDVTDTSAHHTNDSARNEHLEERRRVFGRAGSLVTIFKGRRVYLNSSQVVKGGSRLLAGNHPECGGVYVNNVEARWGGTLWAGFGFNLYFDGWGSPGVPEPPRWVPLSTPNKRTKKSTYVDDGRLGAGPCGGRFVCDKGAARIKKRGRPSKVARIDDTRSFNRGYTTAIKKMLVDCLQLYGMVVPEAQELQDIPVCPRKTGLVKALDTLIKL